MAKLDKINSRNMPKTYELGETIELKNGTIVTIAPCKKCVKECYFSTILFKIINRSKNLCLCPGENILRKQIPWYSIYTPMSHKICFLKYEHCFIKVGTKGSGV